MREERRDEGAVIVLVLVLMVIGSLMVLPLLEYASTVLRANSVLSERTKRIEGAKGGLRATLADTASLYDVCGAGGPNTSVELGTVQVNGFGVENRCYFLDHAGSLADTERRVGLATPQLGQTILADLFVEPTADPSAVLRYSPPAETTDVAAWLAETSPASRTDKIFLPNLPSAGTNARASTGAAMNTTLAGFDPLNPHALPDQCVVFFPGRYEDPLTIGGPAPTFFASGVYYFENEIRVVGGADVVVGDGNAAGCTTTQEALFYAEPSPTGGHNVNGLGATWVLGDGGRLVVDNTTNDEPISVRFNRRYVAPTDYLNQPSAGVAIMTVNGDEVTADPDGEGPSTAVFGDLDVPGVLHVPQSYVGSIADDPTTAEVNEHDPEIRDTSKPATARRYVPSVFTPETRVPDPPGRPSVSARVGVFAVVSWPAPPSDGGSPITGYTVTASPSGATCSTNGALSCAVQTLPNTGSVVFTVRATNANGDSIESVASDPAAFSVGPPPTAPAAPAAPSVTMSIDPAKLDADGADFDPFAAGVAEVRFAYPPHTGGAPITGYEVQLVRTWDLDAGPDLATDDPLDPDSIGLQTDGRPRPVGGSDWVPCASTFDMSRRVTPRDGAPWQPELRCDFTGLDVRAAYAARVRATNARGTSAWSAHGVWDRIDIAEFSLPDGPDAGTDPDGPKYHFDESGANGVSADDLAHFISDTSDDTTADGPDEGTEPDPTRLRFAPTVPVEGEPVAAGSLPTPILELELTSATSGTVTIEIPGYVSVPMGRLLVHNPHGHSVSFTGGVLAAHLDIVDSRATGPNTVPIGFRDEVVQRKFRIESTVPGGITSTAVVQVNQNGVSAVNSWEVQ